MDFFLCRLYIQWESYWISKKLCINFFFNFFNFYYQATLCVHEWKCTPLGHSLTQVCLASQTYGKLVFIEATHNWRVPPKPADFFQFGCHSFNGRLEHVNGNPKPIPKSMLHCRLNPYPRSFHVRAWWNFITFLH